MKTLLGVSLYPNDAYFHREGKYYICTHYSITPASVSRLVRIANYWLAEPRRGGIAKWLIYLYPNGFSMTRNQE